MVRQAEHTRIADAEVHQPVGLERDTGQRDVADLEVDRKPAKRHLNLGVDAVPFLLAFVAGLLGEQGCQRRIEHASGHDYAPPLSNPQHVGAESPGSLLFVWCSRVLARCGTLGLAKAAEVRRWAWWSTDDGPRTTPARSRAVTAASRGPTRHFAIASPPTVRRASRPSPGATAWSPRRPARGPTAPSSCAR